MCSYPIGPMSWEHHFLRFILSSIFSLQKKKKPALNIFYIRIWLFTNLKAVQQDYKFLYLTVQGTMHFVLFLSALLSCIAFIGTKRNCFLYLSIGLTILAGMYLGFFRTQMKKKFNIRVCSLYQMLVWLCVISLLYYPVA